MNPDDTNPRLSLATLVELADVADITDDPEPASDDWVDTREWGDPAGCGS